MKRTVTAGILYTNNERANRLLDVVGQIYSRPSDIPGGAPIVESNAAVAGLMLGIAQFVSMDPDIRTAAHAVAIEVERLAREIARTRADMERSEA